MLTTEQLAFRRTGIGASEISSLIIGVDGAPLDPYGSPRQVWRSKKGIDKKFTARQRAAIEAGNRLEPVVLDWYREEHLQAPDRVISGAEAWPRASVNGTIRHGSRPFALATVDGVVDRRSTFVRVVEAKAVGLRMAQEWGEHLDAVPDRYRCQVLWQMECTGIHEGHLGVVIGGQEFRRYAIPWDADRAAMLIDAAARFWRDFIVTDREPDAIANDNDDLSETHPVVTKPELPSADDRLRAACTAFVQLGRDIKAAEEVREAIGARIRQRLGDSAGVRWDRGKATWTNNANGNCDWQTLARELGATPAQIEAHTPTPGPRVLRVTVKEAT